MNDDQLLRYSRHILLDDIGIEGQQRLLDSHVLVVGAGGLGSPVAMYLAASGVGHITLADPDKVDLTNLQRQIAHTTGRIGQAKVASAAKALHDINPEVRLTLLEKQVQAVDLDQLLPDIDIVVDCCDNFATRQAVNATCVKHRVPLVSGAALRMDGQIAVFDARDELCVRLVPRRARADLRWVGCGVVVGCGVRLASLLLWSRVCGCVASPVSGGWVVRGVVWCTGGVLRV